MPHVTQLPLLGPPQVEPCIAACAKALEEAPIADLGALQGAVATFDALLPGLQERLQTFSQRWPAAVTSLARSSPDSRGLAPLVLRVFGDAPAVLASKDLLDVICGLPFGPFLSLLSSDGLRATSENDVLVGAAAAGNGPAGGGGGGGDLGQAVLKGVKKWFN